MRKNIIALMLILPLLFVFAVFSSAKTASLGVPVGASGIEILGKPEKGALRLDLAEYAGDKSIKAKVLPEAASDRGYTYRVEGDLSVDGEGFLSAERTGESVVTVVSKDGGYEDSVKVVVYSSRPYDFSLSLSSSMGENVLEEEEGGYFARAATGSYLLSSSVLPAGQFEQPTYAVEEGFAVFGGAGDVLFPFSGETVLTASMPVRRGGKDLAEKKRIALELLPVRSESGLSVNGGNPALVVSREEESVSFFVEGDLKEVLPSPYLERSLIDPLGEGRARVTVFFGADRNDFSFSLLGEGEEEVSVSFEEFDFSVRSDLPVQGAETSVLKDVPVTFYALPTVSAEGIGYVWSADSEEVVLEPHGSSCRLTAKATCSFTLEVRALRGGKELDIFPKRIPIAAVERVGDIQFENRTDLGLSSSYVLAGKRYDGEGTAENEYPLSVSAFDGEEERGTDSLLFHVSDGSAARLEEREGKIVLLPVGTGRVEIEAMWQGNASFGTEVKARLSLYVQPDAVAVYTSGELCRAMGEGRAAALERDVLLGSDEQGAPLPAAARAEMLKSMKSTFNTEYYRRAKTESEENAFVRYALEFTNDVYGNGHSLNAEYFTNARDGAGQPLWFRGPLGLVKFGQLASVAAQDNSAFLIRKAVTLYNLTLLGCSDSSLLKENGVDLSALDKVGTVLEINGDARLINCRVRNGRNVVRVYGGNQSGEEYFCESLPDGDKTPIRVLIEGCALAMGREFLLKIGANRALRANEKNGAEPDLLGEDGAPYAPRQERYDEYFTEKYLLTDVTLKDSVLETSGFFCIGLECNFSGELLKEGASGGVNFDGWQGVGGTSFASALRLEGDVRLYDWKDISLIDSSTLIETEMPELKLDVAAMLSYVSSLGPEYGDILLSEGENRFVHGGIALYGGGKNYSSVDLSGLDGERNDLAEYPINLDVLSKAEGNTGYQGQILPSAAGTQDFRFFLYRKDGPCGLAAQRRDAAEGRKYAAVRPLPPR